MGNFSTNVIKVVQIKEDETDRTFSTHGTDEECSLKCNQKIWK